MQQKQKACSKAKSHQAPLEQLKNGETICKLHTKFNDILQNQQKKVRKVQQCQKSQKLSEKVKDWGWSCKFHKNIFITGIAVPLLEFINLQALNVIEYQSQYIILQILITFIIVPIFSLSFHIAFLCLFQSYINQTHKSTTDKINNQNEGINLNIETKPILVEKSSAVNEMKTLKKAIIRDQMLASKEMTTKKEITNVEDKTIHQQVHHDQAKLRLLLIVSKLFNIIVNITLGTACLIIHATTAGNTLNGLFQTQIISLYGISVISIYFTYSCFRHEDRHDNKVNDLQKQEEQSSKMAPRLRRTSLDQQIYMQRIIIQSQIKEKQTHEQNITKNACLSFQSSSLVEHIMAKKSSQKQYPQSQHRSPEVINKEELKRPVLKCTKQDVCQNEKSVFRQSKQKKKVEINIRQVEVFEYCEICPSNDNSEADASESRQQQLQRKRRMLKNANRYNMKMQVQMQLLNKKKNERQCILNALKLPPKLREPSISNEHQDLQKPPIDFF